MRTTGLAVAIAVMGCGGNGGDPSADGRVDGPVVADAPVADAPADADPPDAGTPDANLPDAGPPDAGIDGVPLPPATYVLDAILVPTTTTEVQAYGLDLDSDLPDGDAGVDNQFGSVLAALASMGFDIQRSVNVGVDRGVTIELVSIDDSEALHTYVGTDPNPPACTGPTDTVCRHHLDGTGAFTIAPGAPSGTMPTTTGSMTIGGPGTAVLELSLFNASVVRLAMIGARFRGTVDPTGIPSGKLAGAIPATQIDSEFLPALGDALRAIIAADCPSPVPPDCMCATGSQGELLLVTFDSDDDCVLTDDELRADPFISGFLMPDVTIDGTPALSLGVAVTAVQGSFTPP